ncbi:UDP-N-acetylglucosamine diphosphorylase/glucosamine-1-phosphate N-acetyltransferase [Helicobacter monodelphidis]|uniref:bifunctional UDP-N-acetylglucosamine diphosphorylase/glucosamine-1-phosphate N-acetyltransferase GlmU n=1 Tax=Helicobacter sp. 15-1451 TaxID=2004995 RepID=UPI000DCF21BD|nr:bifunctional UDP-N-acetylglucosamine diphosphorylase/glucosamine-1-phosphate N-acetyltransferase GlmU [Helicobacter sp. 15-1451]RAX58632.1 UDP-N-acetylglucosamine diphosphorylase/glucosamine-1-phosphate N-acetyltransferase [Helicobacter sp. 15-1451]
MRNCSIVILAAGMGSRMKSSTPKVLHQICGREMLYYSLKEALKISDDVSVILYHSADKIQEVMQQHFPKIRFIRQDYENYPGTGGAIISFLKSYTPRYPSLLILNGDMPLVQAEELQQFLDTNAEIVMSVLRLQKGDGYGRIIMQNGQVKGIVEEKDATLEQKKINIVNAGVYLISCEVLQRFLPCLNNNNAQQEYYLTDIVSLALEKKILLQPLEVKEENFKGVNTKLDLSIAEEIMLERIRNYWLNEGVIMHQKESIYIDERAEFIGECEIEGGVKIFGNCKIIDSIIKAHSVVEFSEIAHSDIGPFAHIRPQTQMINTHIGNFVEVKKGILKGVKAGHLSYLGDCEIDEGSNIGAGVITCNYDGKQKHQTRIGKNVFVGSDTQLVAPINLADDVLIAAGSTITTDVPQGSLAISRTKQNHKENFFYTFFNKEKK